MRTSPTTLTGLFVSHVGERCGVYQFGKRLFAALKQSSGWAEQVIDWIYAECSDLPAYNTLASALRPDITVFNYHPLTLAWASAGGWDRVAGTTFSIFHEVYQAAADELVPAPFDFTLCPDPTLVSRNPTAIRVPRFIPSAAAVHHTKPSRFTVGSFGFPTPNKGFARLCSLVNNQFDSAQININLPPHDWPALISAAAAAEVEAECRASITKPDIGLTVTRHFFSDEELLTFLSRNTINAFLYNDTKYRGISSCTDYALACGRPIAISRSIMFRHLHDVCPSVCIEDRSILSIAESALRPLVHHRHEYSEINAGIAWNNAIISAWAMRSNPIFRSDHTDANKLRANPDDTGTVQILNYVQENETLPKTLRSQESSTFAALLLDTVERLASLIQDPRILIVGSQQSSLSENLRGKGYRFRELFLEHSNQMSDDAYHKTPSLRDGYDLVVCSSILADPKEDIFLIKEIEDFLAPSGYALLVARIEQTSDETCDGSKQWDESTYLDWNFPACLLDNFPTCKLIGTLQECFQIDDPKAVSDLALLVVRRFSSQELRRALSPSNFIFAEVIQKRRSKWGTLQESLGKHGRLDSNMFSHFGESEREEKDVVFRSDGIGRGFLLFGPYAPLSAGRYCATIMVRLDEPAKSNEQEIAVIDIVVDGHPSKYERSIQESDLTLGVFRPVSLDFVLSKNADHWEVRMRLAAPIKATALAATAWRPRLIPRISDQ